MAFVRDIEDAFLTELNNSLNIPVIIDYGGGTEPTSDYGVLGITTFNKLHRDTRNSYKLPDGSFKERLKQDYEILMTFSFYGESCYEKSFEAQALLSSVDVLESFYTFNNISIVDITSLRRIPELRETGYIQRVTFDLNMLVGYEFIRDVDWFDTVSYEGDFEDGIGNVILEIDDTVTFNNP